VDRGWLKRDLPHAHEPFAIWAIRGPVRQLARFKVVLLGDAVERRTIINAGAGVANERPGCCGRAVGCELEPEIAEGGLNQRVHALHLIESWSLFPDGYLPDLNPVYGGPRPRGRLL